MCPGVADRERLLAAARQAAISAHCPYSGFRVGAALLSDEGQVFTGCNVENASFGLSTCAERVAVFCAVAGGIRRIVAMAVSCPDAEEELPPNYRMPCGACRQVIAEFAEPETLVFVDGVGQFRVSELLPSPFRLATGISTSSDDTGER